jgi:hypothetical protein
MNDLLILSAILIIEGKNKIFFLLTYPWVKLLSRKGETNEQYFNFGPIQANAGFVFNACRQ